MSECPDMAVKPTCPTTSGPFRCTRGVEGHAGPCETRAPARPWVGPALSQPDLARALRRMRAAEERLMEMTKPSS